MKTKLFLSLSAGMLLLVLCYGSWMIQSPGIGMPVQAGVQETSVCPEEPLMECENIDGQNSTAQIYIGEEATFCFEESAKSQYIAQGSVIHTLKKITVVTDASGIPSEGGFEEYGRACTYDATGKESKWYYPDFIQEDGSFVKDVRLVLLDIEVTNHNAKNWTVFDLDENGNPKGHYENPYIFRIDGKYWISKYKNVGSGLYWTPAFFSGLNQVNEHQFAYELLPGETKTFTVGFLIGNNADVTSQNISDLYVRIPWGLIGAENETQLYREKFIDIQE